MCEILKVRGIRQEKFYFANNIFVIDMFIDDKNQVTGYYFEPENICPYHNDDGYINGKVILSKDGRKGMVLFKFGRYNSRPIIIMTPDISLPGQSYWGIQTIHSERPNITGKAPLSIEQIPYSEEKVSTIMNLSNDSMAASSCENNFSKLEDGWFINVLTNLIYHQK